MISNINLSYPSRIHECTLTSTGVFVPELPLENIKNPVFSRVARTTTTANFSITATLAQEERAIGCVALAGHNLSINAKVRFRGYSSSGTLRFDSGSEFRAYPILFPVETGQVPFESNNWFLGTVEDDQRKDYTALATYYPDDNQMCKTIVIDIVDPLNASGYLEIGFVFLGRNFEPKHNPEYGNYQQGYIDLSDTRNSANNTMYGFKKPKMRTISAVLSHLDKLEAFGGLYDAKREVGLTGLMLYTFSKPEYIGGLNMTRDKHFYAQTMIVRFSALGKVDFVYVNGFKVDLQLQEVV
ncbi:MAG: hypothetical protein WBI40_09285 [Methylococcaceae bacterium]